MPVDGTFPTGTAKFEKRSIALEIPIWDPEHLHRMRPVRVGLPACRDSHQGLIAAAALAGAPDDVPIEAWPGKDFAGYSMTIQVAPDDCTGCGVCVDVCPAKSKEVVRHKAINMEPKLEHLDARAGELRLLPQHSRSSTARRSRPKRSRARRSSSRCSSISGACAGCGETPYVKLMTQLFGDRMMIGNATGCSSIYGGNLPTTP